MAEVHNGRLIGCKRAAQHRREQTNAAPAIRTAPLPRPDPHVEPVLEKVDAQHDAQFHRRPNVPLLSSNVARSMTSASTMA